MNVLEKILEEIKIEYNALFRHANKDYLNGIADMYLGTKEIIRSHMDDGKDMNVPSNDGWIPVEERLPEEGQKVLVWYEYFRYGEYNCMFKTYGIGWQFDGHWSGDVSGTKARCIAWRPLPEQYRGDNNA